MRGGAGMLLSGIYLHNFAVLHDVALGLDMDRLRSRDKSDLGCPILPLTALIGKNSTGKSSLMDALSFITDSLKHGVPYAATMNGRGGFAKLLTAGSDTDFICRLLFFDEQNEYYLQYELKISCDGHGRPYVSQERVIRRSEDENGQEQLLLDLEHGEGYILEGGRQVKTAVEDKKYPALAAYGVIRSYRELCSLYWQISHWYFQKEEKTVNGRPGQRSQGGHKHLDHNCHNVHNVLTYYREEHPHFYNSMIRRISEKLNGGKPADEAYINGDMTSGNLKLFTYLLLLEDPDPRPLLCLEFPDAGLYHEMVDVLAHEMRDYTVRNPDCQIIYSTHNPYMLDAMSPDEVWVFARESDKAKSKSEKTRYAQVRCAGSDPLVREMYGQGIGLGAIWYGGHFELEK